MARIVVILLGISSGYSFAGRQPEKPKEILLTLSTAAAVHGLSPSEAKRRYPVRLRAVCVVCFPGWHGLFVNDGSAGVYVETKDQVLLTDAIHTGSMLEIQGVTGPGEFSPVIDQAVLRVTGEGAVPFAPHVSLDRLSTGVEDGQWVEIDGTVRSADTSNTMLTLVVASGRLQLKVMTPRYRKEQYLRLIDARVSVRGTAGPVFNQRRQLIDVNMYTPGLNEVRVLEPAPEDPFALPVKTVRNVFEYTPGSSPDHRIRIRGVVTALWPGEEFFITDGVQGASVLSTQMTSLQPGDLVDVAGFSALGDYTPSLHEAIFRKLGSGAPPVPRSVTAAEALSGNFAGDLVRIEGRLIKQGRTTDQHTFLLDAGRIVFSAILPADPGDGQRDLRDGSQIELTGICAVTETQAARHYQLPTAFQILIRSPKDIRVLRKSSWWTPEHTRYAFGVTAVIVACVFAWFMSLRRELRRLVQLRTAELEESHRKLHVMATRDDLTQLWNRRAVMDILARELTRCAREHSELAVVMIDLDHFKEVNDIHGHLAGDAVLIAVSQRVRSAIRPYDSVGRYGGEEFLLILPGIPVPEADRLLRRVHQSVCAAPIQVAEDRAIRLTCSLGVVRVTAEVPSLQQAISQADTALYRAKALGRNRIEYAGTCQAA
ncbi:MAG: GGDEF domain-containing protein [Bryobacteraceae bacterium]|jgi:diguanylate cyclase (GGDEF)-like protein